MVLESKNSKINKFLKEMKQMTMMRTEVMSKAVRALKGMEVSRIENAIEEMQLTAQEKSALKSAFKRPVNTEKAGMWY